MKTKMLRSEKLNFEHRKSVETALIDNDVQLSSISRRAVKYFNFVDWNIFSITDNVRDKIFEGDFTVSCNFLRCCSRWGIGGELNTVIDQSLINTTFNSQIIYKDSLYARLYDYSMINYESETFDLEMATNDLRMMATYLQLPVSCLRIDLFHSRANWQCNYLEFRVFPCYTLSEITKRRIHFLNSEDDNDSIRNEREVELKEVELKEFHSIKFQCCHGHNTDCFVVVM